MSEINETVNTNPEAAAPAAPEAAPVPEAVPTDSGLAAFLAKFNVTNANQVITNLQGLGVSSVEDLAILSDTDLVGAGVLLVPAKKMLADLKGAATPTPAPSPAPAAPNPMMNRVILPEVPSEESWLQGLKSGGVLKCNQTSYISAVRATLANQLNIKELLKKLCELIVSFAEESDEPVPEIYWDLRKQVNRRGEYADIFAAIGGKNSVTEADRNRLIDRMKKTVWPAAAECYRQTKIWKELWDNSISPGMAMVAMTHQAGGILPPSVGAMPDTSPIRDAADELRNAINRALSGVGPAAAASIACDYLEVKKILSDTNLPSCIGVAGREQMFKRLGIEVGSSLIRMENNLVQFILGMVQADVQTADVEGYYFTALWNLGTQIDWMSLGVNVEDGVPTSGGFQSVTGRAVGRTL